MEIEVDKAISSLDSVAPLCNGRVSAMLYNCRVFYDEAGWVGFSGTDLNTAIHVGQTDGKWFAINAAKLLAALKTFPEGSKAKVILKDGVVQIVCGSSKFKMPTVDPNDYPSFSVAEPEYPPVEISLAWLTEAFAVVSPAVGKDSAKSALTGIIFEVKQDGQAGRAWINGCDGRRMIVGSLKLGDETYRESSVSVPVSVFKALSTLPHGDGIAKVSVGKNTIRIEGDGWVILSRLVEGRIPDWRLILGTGVAKKKVVWTGTAGALRMAISQCLLIDDDQCRINWKIPSVKPAKEGEEEPKGALQMEAHDTIDGEAKSEAVGDVDGTMDTFSINGRFVVDALKGEKDEDEVKLHIHPSSMKLHIVRGGYDALVMGMA